MKIVIAPDSFKDSATAAQVCDAITGGLRRVVPDAEIVAIPMADGGEGTVDALVAATGGRLQQTTVCGPLGRAQQVQASYGILGLDGETNCANDRPTTAVIEMAAAAGLPLVPPDRRNPLHTTTFGLGQIISHAIRHECRDFIIGIGGSATNECGTGAAQALGVKFIDDQGNEIREPMTGQSIGQVAKIDLSGLLTELAECRFTIACDVQNPLLGQTGATRTYGPQKGADETALATLEKNMAHIIDMIEGSSSRSVRDIPGAGAAGGLGAGLMAFLNAQLQPGIEIVINACRFAQRIAGADLIITGEGRIDGQTIFGKTIAGVAATAAEQSIPVIALAGSLGPDARKVLGLPVAAILSICPGPMPLDLALRQASALLADTAEQAIRLALTNLQ